MGRAVAVAEKIPGDSAAIAWNHALNNSVFHNVRWKQWPLDVVKEAIRAGKASGLHFGGVDVMVHNDIPYILEMNSAPSVTTKYRQRAMALGLKYIQDNIEDLLPLNPPENVRTYKDLILPTVLENRVAND